MEQTGGRYFGVWDYAVFGTMLVLSMAIGLYSACSGGRQRTAEEFFLGDRKMGLFPVAMSLLASWATAATIIAVPAEIYMYDCMMLWTLVASPLAYFLVGWLFLPVLFRIKVTSVYEYLEMRFSRSVRLVCTFTFIFQTFLNMGLTLYIPALAINAVTGMNLWASVVSTGIVCTIYTTLGGIKAVMWTDTLQALIMLCGIIAITIKGLMEVGGFAEVWRIGVEGGRVEFFELSPDPRVRFTIWGAMFGFTTSLTANGVNQIVMQRLYSAGTRKRAIKVMCLTSVVELLTVALCGFLGLLMYAYFVDCDPLTSGVVSSQDQIMLVMVMQLFAGMPGLPGLILASLVSASISTLSSGMNSVSALIGEDVVKSIWPKISPEKYTKLVKIIACLFGLMSIGCAYVITRVQIGVLQIGLSISGMTTGGVFGAFVMGVFMPRSNTKGVLAGFATSVTFIAWITVGSIFFYPSYRGMNSLSTEGCPVDNATEFTTTMERDTTWPGVESSPFPTTLGPGPDTQGDIPRIAALYHISFVWYTFIGLIITVTFGMLFSGITGFTDPDTVNPRLVSKFTDVAFACFPESFKRKFGCGIIDPLYGDDDDDANDDDDVCTDV